MQTANRTPRTFELELPILAIASLGESNHRAVVALLDARSEDADHPLMPLRVVQAQAIATCHVYLFQCKIGRILHIRLYTASRQVQFVQLLRHTLRFALVIS